MPDPDEFQAELAATPEPPYIAVIFTSIRCDGGDQGYATMSAAMDALAARQPGYLGVESARQSIGITVSYWRDEAAARAWKQVGAHLIAQRRGREVWYRDYRVRIATVHRDYGPDHDDPTGHEDPTDHDDPTEHGGPTDYDDPTEHGGPTGHDDPTEPETA